MKKKLGALVLALASLAISAACASSGYTQTPQQDSDENTVQARPTELPDQHATETADETVRVAR
jgi:ABC-type phosphate/phosphonate transport system substrate-binding protein